MAGEWKEVAVEEIASKIAMGPFGSDIKTDNFVPSGVPVIRGVNLTSGRFHAEEFVFLTEEKADELANANAFPGDVVFTHRGTLGQVGLIPDRPFNRYVVSQSQMKLTCDPKIADPAFVYYFFRSPIGQYALLMNTSQTGVPAISRPITSLKCIRLSLPSPPEQRASAHILGTLDDKIELNRRMNETLEAMARAIFKSWFLDATEDGLPADWRESTIGELCEFAYGRSLKEEIRRPGSIPVYGSNGQVGWHDEALVKGPGIVIGRKGNPGMVTWSPTDFFPIDTTFYVVPKGDCRSLYFLFYALRAHDLASLGADSAVPGLNRNLAYMSRQAVPSQRLLDAFDEQMRPLFDRIHHNAEASRTLAALRDTLLPKLISGKLRVPLTKVAV